MEKNNLENKSNDAPVPDKTTVMSEEKVYRLFIKPIQDEETQKIFRYLRRWRCQSSRSDFTFDRYSIAA